VATRRLEKVRGEPGADSPGSSPSITGAAAAAAGLAGVVEAPLTFEQAITRLGEIVDGLEEGEQPLEESIALFEEGMSLAKSSQEILDRAERRIEELLGVDSQGKPIVREIEPD
jgi:exodeoxyribonuclease VII small subunit